MTTPLIARLLLDGLDEFIVAAETVPEIARDMPVATMNCAAWVINHVGAGIDNAVNVVIGGGEPTMEWKQDLDYEHGLDAFRRTFNRTFGVLIKLHDDDVDSILNVADRHGMPSPTIGLVLARNVGHVFAHASELHAITHAAGGELRWQLPGGGDYTRGKLVLGTDVGKRVRIQWYEFDTAVTDAGFRARSDRVIREVTATVERVDDAGRFLDRQITVRRDDGTSSSFKQEFVRLAVFEPC
jgi:hypothetical protein